MAITNHERVGKARDAQGWLNIVRESVTESQARLFTKASNPPWDATSLLAGMWNQWSEVCARRWARPSAAW